MDTRTVVLFGQSMLLSLIAASLERSPDLCVARAATWAEVSGLLAKRVPDAIIFDLAHACEGHILPLLLTNPRLLLIGLDPESNQAVLISGQKTGSLTLNQIRDIVERT